MSYPCLCLSSHSWTWRDGRLSWPRHHNSSTNKSWLYLVSVDRIVTWHWLCGVFMDGAVQSRVVRGDADGDIHSTGHRTATTRPHLHSQAASGIRRCCHQSARYCVRHARRQQRPIRCLCFLTGEWFHRSNYWMTGGTSVCVALPSEVIVFWLAHQLRYRCVFFHLPDVTVKGYSYNYVANFT